MKPWKWSTLLLLYMDRNKKRNNNFQPASLVESDSYHQFYSLSCAAAMAKRPAPGAVPGPVGPVPWQLQGCFFGVLLEGNVFLNWEICIVRTSFKWQFVITILVTILVHPCAWLRTVIFPPGRWWGCSGGTGCRGLWCFKLRSLTGEFVGYFHGIPEVQIV